MNLVRLQPKGGGGTDLKPFIVEFSANNNDFNGQEVVMHYLGTPHAGETVVDVSGTVINRKLTLYPLHDGIWSISSETIDGKAFRKKITLEKWKEYNVTLAIDFDFNEWLRQGRVTKTFDSLDEILKDEKTIRQLMIVHNSVDYLVGALANDETKANIILDNDLCAKWINLSDYALDMLYADENVKAVMDSVDKYGYGEWTLLPQVPKMTTNTAPSGEASAYGGGSGAYFAFDGNYSQSWNAENANPNWIQYKFTEKKVINGIYFSLANGNTKRIKTWTLQASNDNFASDASTIDIASGTGNDNEKLITFNNSTAYQYYRLFNTVDSGNNTAILELQFYSWGAKGNVPIMTSNNAPYGIVLETNHYSGHDSFYAFDGLSTTRWINNDQSTTTSAYIGYGFKNPTCVKSVKINGNSNNANNRPKAVMIQGSNDNSEWVDLLDSEQTLANDSSTKTISIPSNKQNYYLYYKAVFNGSYLYGIGCELLQFYGRELKVSDKDVGNIPPRTPTVVMIGSKTYWENYSEKEFEVGTNAKWIYDHGVELVTLTKTATSVLANIDRGSTTLLIATAGRKATNSDKIARGSGNSTFTNTTNPYNWYLDISSLNGTLSTGFSQVADTIDISCWLE